MSNILQIKEQLQSYFPEFTIEYQEYGLMVVYVLKKRDLIYQIEITPNDGIGVTYRKIEDIDFGGSDEVFENLESAIIFLKDFYNNSK